MDAYIGKNDDEINIEFYTSLVNKFGINHNSLNWGSKLSQLKRFEILASIGINPNDKILDVGCGLGDFYSWLQKNIPEVDYHGIDITAAMINEAKKKNPDLQIENKLIFDIKEKEPLYDYVIASGIFYLRKDKPFEYMLSTIEKMFQLSKKGIAFNSLSTWSKKINKNEFYADPLELISAIKTKFSKKIIFRHDYLPNDFSLYVYK